MKKQKLELTWIGKENRPKLEPRILLEDPAKSYHAKHRVTDDEVGAERSLLVLCSAFRIAGVSPAGGRDVRAPSEYPNLTVKKIPKQVLSRCEWGHDDYSLRVENLPKAIPHPNPPPGGEGTKAKGRAAKSANVAQGGLFDETTSHSTKPASGQVAGYVEGEV